jgi:hypothetical protein
VLTFAVPQQALQSLIPPCLTLDTYKDQWAFIAVAMVDTSQLRPKGFPAFMGRDFFLIGYRIFVRYTSKDGKNLRGLYILKSETNSKAMQVLGNMLTHYAYTTTDIVQQENDEKLHIHSNQSGIDVIINKRNENASLPIDSPFENWQHARRYAGPLPHTFTFDAKTNEVLIIEGVRSNWVPKPIEVVSHNIDFLDKLNLGTIVLANAFELKNIPYYWKKGRVEIWQP